jgi:predicted DNA-binding transcriptional regulator AlpA
MRSAHNASIETKQQTADRIGVSLRTLNRLMHSRTSGEADACPPWMRVSPRRVVFDAAAVEVWLEARTTEQRRRAGAENTR